MCKTPQEILFSGPELDPLCTTGTLISGKIDETMQSWQDGVLVWMGEALGTSLKALTTAWIHIGSPGLTDGDPANNVSSQTVSFLQNSLAWIAGCILAISLIGAAARMALTNKSDPAKNAFTGVLQFIGVNFAGVGIIGLVLVITDAFSIWIIDQSTQEKFGQAIANMLTDTGGLAFLLILLFGGLGLIVTIFQIFLLIWRGGALVVLTGTLPLASAAGTTELGKPMFYKHLGWIVAYLFYKPAAAIIYATAFSLISESDYRYDDTKTIEHIAGLALLSLAIVALPAMIRLASVLTAAVASGKGIGGVMAGALAMALPTGAAMAMRGAAGAASSGGDSGGGGGGSGGASGSGGGGGGGNSGPSPAGGSSGGGGGGAEGSSSGGGGSADDGGYAYAAASGYSGGAEGSSSGGNGAAQFPASSSSHTWGGNSGDGSSRPGSGKGSHGPAFDYLDQAAASDSGH